MPEILEKKILSLVLKSWDLGKNRMSFQKYLLHLGIWGKIQLSVLNSTFSSFCVLDIFETKTFSKVGLQIIFRWFLLKKKKVWIVSVLQTPLYSYLNICFIFHLYLYILLIHGREKWCCTKKQETGLLVIAEKNWLQHNLYGS